jgi:choline dehydrogenase-like flavoprotein
MIADARTIGISELDADIVIIGTGPAGMAVGIPLLGSRRKLVFIEAGGYEPDLDLQQTFWSAGQEIVGTHPPLHLYRRRVLGGTSTVWGGRCLPLDPTDFRPIPGVRSEAWPIEYDQVAAYYPAALRFLDAGACEFQAETAFRDSGEVLPDGQTTRVERFSLPTDVGRKFRKTLAADRDALVLLNAPCVEILAEPEGRAVAGARCRVAGRDLVIRSRVVILATGGLENARLLLASNARQPAGLGNEHGLVGRYYMSQLTGNYGRLRFDDSAVERFFGLRRTHDGVYGQRIIHLDDSCRLTAGLMNLVFRPSVADAADPGHADAILSTYYMAQRLLGSPENKRRYRISVPEAGPALTRSHFTNVVRQLPSAVGFAARWTLGKRMARRRIPILSIARKASSYPLEFNSEQLPNANSRVFLSTDRDPLGVPLLNVDWQVGSVDRQNIARGYRLISGLLAATGKMSLAYREEELEEAIEQVAPCGGHHIGTARMGLSAAAGVVGPDCQVWGTQGLYVTGSAVFPTAGYANPTLTIVALSLRLAEHLKETEARASA